MNFFGYINEYKKYKTIIIFWVKIFFRHPKIHSFCFNYSIEYFRLLFLTLNIYSHNHICTSNEHNNSPQNDIHSNHKKIMTITLDVKRCDLAKNFEKRLSWHIIQIGPNPNEPPVTSEADDDFREIHRGRGNMTTRLKIGMIWL